MLCCHYTEEGKHSLTMNISCFQAGSTGVGTGMIFIGGAAIGLSSYLERQRQTRRLEILTGVMDKCHSWLNDQEQNAKVRCQIEAGE